MEKQKRANIFAGNEAEDFASVESMTRQIRDLGGMLHFTITRSGDGWMAKCNEVEGIITGGLNPDPSEFEIESQIREAIYTAFDINVNIPVEKLQSSVSQLALSVV